LSEEESENKQKCHRPQLEKEGDFNFLSNLLSINNNSNL
jgi:hypothetical protein